MGDVCEIADGDKRGVEPNGVEPNFLWMSNAHALNTDTFCMSEGCLKQAGMCESTHVQWDMGEVSVHSPCMRDSGLGVGVACSSAELAVTSASVSACVAVCDCGWDGARLRGPVFPAGVGGRLRGVTLRDLKDKANVWRAREMQPANKIK